MKRFLGRLAAGSVALILIAVSSARAMPPAEEIVDRVKAVYATHCCFKAFFKQITVNTAMNLRERFEGRIFVKKPSSIALEVEYPEKQRVLLEGRKYTVFFPTDGHVVQGECPPGLNIEHFIGFFANVGKIDVNFTVQYPEEALRPQARLIMLELNQKEAAQSAYRVVLGVDMDRFTIRRAIIYDALGNYNRFDLSGITFLDSIPEETFTINPPSSKGVGQAFGPLFRHSAND